MIDEKRFDDLVVQATRTEERAKSNTKRIDEIEKDRKELSDSLTRMASAVEVLATEQKHSSEAQKQTKEKLEGIDEKINKIETAPAQSATRLKEKVVEIIVAAILGAIIGAVFALILK